VPGEPRHRAADLLIATEGVVVSQGQARAELSWDDRMVQLDSSADGWMVDAWSSGQSGPIGIGLRVSGRYTESTASVRKAATTFFNRLNRFLQSGTVVPLCAAGRISRSVDADRDAIAALVELLADRPTTRVRLSDENAVARLAEDLVSQPHGALPFKMGGKRKTVEILNAMRSLGYEHRFGGRPLPDDDPESSDTIVPRVVDKMRANPYAQGVEVSEDDVRHVVHSYRSVSPWPFGALLDGQT
jgi:hypothetical protein